tara:strand:+ start:892 stop:1002 length:111 start_codon:yes stop_codon:yes gene_type:complete
MADNIHLLNTVLNKIDKEIFSSGFVYFGIASPLHLF